MRRRLFTIAAALSLLLCAATVALWIRSFWVADSLYYTVDLRQDALVSWRGRVGYEFTPMAPDYPPSSYWSLDRFAYEHIVMGAASWGEEPDFAFAGFEVARDSGTYTYIVPHWSLVLAFAALPGWWMLRQHRRRRLSAFACRSCGYDLRATPDRCPECGAVPQKQSIAQSPTT